MTDLHTGCWTNLWRADKAGLVDVTRDLLPVRISRAAPKFWPAAERFPALESLMPDAWVLAKAAKDPEWDWARAFRRKLHTIGLERIRSELDNLAEVYQRPLVLCCFEADPDTCHRGHAGGFAAWWQRKTGVEIQELVFNNRADDGADRGK